MIENKIHKEWREVVKQNDELKFKNEQLQNNYIEL